MAKGFKPQSKPDDSIHVASMVASRTLTPAVSIQWGKQQAQLPSEQARHHAYAVLEAIAAAELDACLTRWAIEKIGLEPEQAVQILMLFRQKRETNALPSVTMNLGNGEHIRPETAKQRAASLLDMAFGTEVEAFLVAFLIQDLHQSGEMADMLIQEFREMRGAITLWSQEDDR